MRHASLLILLSGMMAACASETSSPPAPRWEKGPGCTLYTMHRLSDSTSEILVQRFDHCLRVEWDSTLATVVRAPGP